MPSMDRGLVMVSGVLITVAPLIGFSTFLISWVGSALVVKNAERIGLLDVPNSRSSHSKPIPRGGGIGVVVAMVASYFLVAVLIPGNGYWLVIGAAGLAVAVVGFVDDIRTIGVMPRLAVHALGAIVVVAAVLLHVRGSQLSIAVPGIWQLAVAAVASVVLVGFTNVFNFMDGIDAIAGAQAVFMAGAAGILIGLGSGHDAELIVSIGTSAACAGFLLLNFPPARVFMGDVGSGFLGFSLAALAVSTVAAGMLPVSSWAILSASFITDSALTLIVRGIRGENIFRAHRSHVYQILARRLGSHGRVVYIYVAINALWLFPLARLAQSSGSIAAAMCVVIAYTPLCLVAMLVGAGQGQA